MSTIKKINGIFVPNTFVTGFTYDDQNKLTILQNGRPDLNVYLNKFSGLTVNGSVSATTYYGDGSNLTGIVKTDHYVTGGTFSGSTLILYRNGLSNVIITGFTGGGDSISGDTYVSGFSYNKQNKLTISQNGKEDLNVYINNFSGLTVNGSLSATTYNGDGIGLTNIPISGITNLQTNLNNKLNISGGTITGNLTVNGDFTVLGTATTINTETLLVKDNIITLNSNYSGNTEPFIGNSGIEVLRGSATTATLLWDETNNYWVAGLSGSTKRILLSGDTTDYYVTGGTFSGSTLTLQRNGLIDVTITGFTSTDTYVSGFSYSNNNITLSQNQNKLPITVNISTMTGLTINGNLNVTGNTTTNALYASIVSGNTVYGNNFPDLPFTDGQTLELYADSSGTTYARLKEFVSAPTGGTRTFLGNIDITSGLTVTGSTILKNGLTASTINISSTPTISTTNTQFLTRNSTTGNVEYRNFNSIATGDTFVTGFSYNKQNKLTIIQNGKEDLNVYINEFSGISINGLSQPNGYALSVTGDTIFSGDVYVTGDLTYNGNLLVTGGTTIQNGLTANTIYTDYIDFNTSTATTITSQFGRINWDSGTGTLNIGIGDATTGLFDFQVGQEEVVRVFNAEATPLTAGTIVYVSGSHGNRPAVKKALATSDGYSVTTLGMVDATIPSLYEGYVTTFGMINNLNTVGLTGGTPIWLSATIPGAYTTTKPKAPDHTVLIGYVVRVHASTGSVFVNISNGWELDELHDVRLNGRSQGDLLVYSGYNGSNVWVNSKKLNGDYTINGGLTVTGVTSGGTFYGSGIGLTSIPISGVTNLQTELDKKFDKSGGTINGNITINGNLSVTGSSSFNTLTGNTPVFYGTTNVRGNLMVTGNTTSFELSATTFSSSTINTTISNNQVVFSNNGILSGSTNLTWTNSASTLTVRGNISGTTIYANDYPDLPLSDGQTLEIYTNPTGQTYVRLKEIISAPTGGTRTFLGNIDITSGLTVTGSTILKNGLTASTINTPITNNQIVYSNNGTLTGSTNLFWNNSTTTLSISGNTNNIGSISATTFYGSGLGLNNIPISGVTNLQTELDKKFDKSGGTISGNVTINGNLTITGNTSLSAFTGSSGTITGDLTVNGQINLPQPYSSTTLNYKASPYYKTVITNTNLDQVFYVDNYIELFWDDVTTDDIELTILTNPTVSKVHVIRNNVTNNTVGIFDLNIASGRTAIDPEMDNDDRSEITIWAPSDSTWPFYRILIVKSNSTNYTNTPAYVLIEKFT